MNKEKLKKPVRWENYNDQLRRNKFGSGYKHKHPILFDYHYFNKDEKEEFLKQYIDPDMYWAEKNNELDFVVEEPSWEVYKFPLITKELSNMIIEEVEHFNEWVGPKEGPNYYIAYGTTDTFLEAIPGTRNDDDKPLEELYQSIEKKYIKSVIKHVWKYNAGYYPASRVLKYEKNKQEFLRPHHDDTICTSVLSLNDNYKGGGTWFERQKFTVNPKAGWCSLHPAKLTHRHAGKRVTEGKRYIIVTFIS